MIPQQFTNIQDGALSFTNRDGSNGPWWWYLDLHGTPLYFLSGSCGTCEAIYERVGTLDTPLTPQQLSATLNAGLDAVTPEVVQTVAPLLPKGRYTVNILSILPTRRDQNQSQPHVSCAADYFWWRLFDQREHGIFYELILPCVAETALDAERIAFYRAQIAQGHKPTALAFSFSDSRGLGGGRYRQGVHVHMLIDGHHKVMAASQLGQPIQVLSFFCENPYSGIGTVVHEGYIHSYYAEQSVLSTLADRLAPVPQPTIVTAQFWWAKAITQMYYLIKRMLGTSALER